MFSVTMLKHINFHKKGLVTINKMFINWLNSPLQNLSGGGEIFYIYDWTK